MDHNQDRTALATSQRGIAGAEEATHNSNGYGEYEIADQKLEFRKKLYFLAGWIVSGIIPAALYENLNLLLFPFFSIPFLSITYVIAPDGRESDYLAIAAWVLAVVAVISVGTL